MWIVSAYSLSDCVGKMLSVQKTMKSNTPQSYGVLCLYNKLDHPTQWFYQKNKSVNIDLFHPLDLHYNAQNKLGNFFRVLPCCFLSGLGIHFSIGFSEFIMGENVQIGFQFQHYRTNLISRCNCWCPDTFLNTKVTKLTDVIFLCHMHHWT